MTVICRSSLAAFDVGLCGSSMDMDGSPGNQHLCVLLSLYSVFVFSSLGSLEFYGLVFFVRADASRDAKRLMAIVALVGQIEQGGSTAWKVAAAQLPG